MPATETPTIPRFWVVGATVVLVAVTACGPEPDSPLSEDEATERVEEHITQTAEGALPNSIELTPFYDTITAGCEADPLVTVSQAYLLESSENEDGEDNEAYVDAIVSYWEDNDYTIRTDNRPDDLFVNTRNNVDLFTMSVRDSSDDRLFLSASSPCLHPSGTD